MRLSYLILILITFQASCSTINQQILDTQEEPTETTTQIDKDSGCLLNPDPAHQFINIYCNT